jgi:lipoprotein signal peptidase
MEQIGFKKILGFISCIVNSGTQKNRKTSASLEVTPPVATLAVLAFAVVHATKSSPLAQLAQVVPHPGFNLMLGFNEGVSFAVLVGGHGG